VDEAMIYELRIYDILPGRLAAITNRFAYTTSRFFAKHGIQVVGYWEDPVGTSNRLTCSGA
jgi:NIPSNAP